MTEHRVPNGQGGESRPSGVVGFDRTGRRPAPAVPPSHAFDSMRGVGRAPVRRVRPSAAPGRADLERYLRYLMGPNAFSA